MEFKGTRKLRADLKNNKVLKSNGVLIIANVNYFDEKAKYDTLLYSKSPEMLEMLQNLIENYYINCLVTEEEVKLLIKQATEL